MSDVFLEDCLSLLGRTPATLDSLLRGLSGTWTAATEGPGTWSPCDVLGHLIHCEKVDWVPRLEIILKYGSSRPFDPVDREAMLRDPIRKPLAELLDEFQLLRHSNLVQVRAFKLQPEQLELTGMHPALGVVTLRQLIATWTTHDLAHIVQIARTMAKRNREAVGPWAEFLSVMK